MDTKRIVGNTVASLSLPRAGAEHGLEDAAGPPVKVDNDLYIFNIQNSKRQKQVIL